MNTLPQIILASGSARRSELLSQIGVRFSVLITDLDESRAEGETPRDYVKRMAVEKALAGKQQSASELPVLGADTVVLLDDQILGKPVNSLDAQKMLNLISDRGHLVLSAVALAQSGHDPQVVLNTTRVTFSEIPEEFIERYCASDDPMDKAGAYAIQGEPGIYVSRIEGSYSGVMGLPLFETACLLRRVGLFS